LFVLFCLRHIIDTSLWRLDNVLWMISFGWILATSYLIAALLMAMTVVGWQHSKLCVSLAGYFLWPFGKYIVSNDDDIRLRNQSIDNYGSISSKHGNNNNSDDNDDDNDKIDNEESFPILGSGKSMNFKTINDPIMPKQSFFSQCTPIHFLWYDKG
jgi:hypothetical protein